APRAGPARARAPGTPARRLAGVRGRLRGAGAAVRAWDRCALAARRVRAADRVRHLQAFRARGRDAVSVRTRSSLVLVLVSLVLAFGLDAGALRWLPVPLRVVLGFVLLVWLPGLGWARAIGARPAGGPAFVSAWATGYGIVWLGLWVLAARALGVPFTLLAHAGAAWTAVPWLVSLATAPRNASAGASHATTRTAERTASQRGRDPLAIACQIAIALALLLAVVAVARHGPPLTCLTDSPDHLGTIRRMLVSGDPFPRDAFFRDAGPAGVDPRKGLWHPCVALVCALAHADPVDAWHALAAILAALAVLTASGFAF